MKNKVANVLKKSGLPALVVSNSETNDFVFRVFTVTANNEETTVLIGGGDEATHSPIDGEVITPKEGVSETASTADDVLANFPVIAHCTNCDHDLHASKELAASMDGVGFHCMKCGSKVEGDYAGDLTEDDSEDDSSEDDALNMDDSEDEEDTSDSEDVTDALEEDASEDGDEDDMNGDSDPEDSENDSEGDSEDDSSEDDSEDNSEDDSEDDSDMGSEEAKIVTDIEFATLYGVDTNSNDIRVVKASESRYEVFVSDRHIGHMNLDKASANVQNLATNPSAFTRSAIMALATDLNKVKDTGAPTDDLAMFGMTLSTVTVPVTDVVDQMVTEKVSEVTEAVEAKQAETASALLKAMEIAMGGLNKGIIPGPNLVSEFARTLTRFGVHNAVEEAAKVVKATSSEFLNTAYEKAKEIVAQGPDYARGLSVSIERASYIAPTVETIDPSLITSATFRVNPSTPAPSTEVASVSQQSRQAKYGRLFKRL